MFPDELKLEAGSEGILCPTRIDTRHTDTTAAMETFNISSTLTKYIFYYGVSPSTKRGFFNKGTDETIRRINVVISYMQAKLDTLLREYNNVQRLDTLSGPGKQKEKATV